MKYEVPDMTFDVPKIELPTKLRDMIKIQERRKRNKLLLGATLCLTTIIAVGIIQFKDIGKYTEEA